MIKTAITTLALTAALAFSGAAMAQEMTSGNNSDGTPRSTYDGGQHSDAGNGNQRAEYCQRTHQQYICTFNAD